MLAKLKIEGVVEISDGDRGVALLLEAWIRGSKNRDLKGVRNMIEWYEKSGIKKNKVISVYRGLYFGIDFLPKLFNNNELSLKDKGYTSWTVSDYQAIQFSLRSVGSGGFGIVMSQQIKNNYIDVNASTKYLLEKDIFIMRYPDECEIITTDPCKKCSFKDIECISIFPFTLRLYLEYQDTNNISIDKEKLLKFDKDGRNVVYIIPKKNNFEIVEFSDLSKEFKIKPDLDDCVYIGG